MMATLTRGQYNKLIEDLHAKKETRTVSEVTANVYDFRIGRKEKQEEIEKFNTKSITTKCRIKGLQR